MTDQTGQDAQQPERETQPASRTEISELPQDIRDLIRNLRDENANRRKESERLTQEMQTRQDAELAEQQRWKELAEQRAAKLAELETVQTHASDLEQTLDSVLDSQIASLPDDAQQAVNDMPGNAKQKLDWLAKNGATLARQSAPHMDAGARGDVRTTPDIELTVDQKAAAKSVGWTEEQYIAAMIKPSA